MFLVSRLLDANRRVSQAIEGHLPHARNLSAEYSARAARLLQDRPGCTVLDIGGGKRLSFDRTTTGLRDIHAIALDIDAAELAHNRDADQTIVADASERIPLADRSVDVIVSRTVMEHLPDVDRFVSEAARVLAPDGVMLHFFPAKWAPFSIINRMLPHDLSRRLLYTLKPSSRTTGGFPAYYDRCSAGAFTRTLLRHGFTVNRFDVSFYQSWYYGFFLPAYLASVVYDALAATIGHPNLAAYLMVEAHFATQPVLPVPDSLM